MKMIKLEQTEKKTLYILLFAGLLNGVVMSSFQLQDIIAKKALSALDWQITLLVMLQPISNLMSIWWGKILEHSRSISRYFVLTAFVGRLILILMLFVKNYYHFLGILIIVFSFNALLSPAQNSIYQKKFSPKNRGFVFGFTSSLATLVLIITSYVAGKLLDVNEDWFRYFFALAGILGCLSSLLTSLIKIEKKELPPQTAFSFKKVIFSPIIRAFDVLKKNKNYALFQRNYFIYGTAFMIILPAIPKFLVEDLQMNYSQTFTSKAVISQLGILVLAPLAGMIHDRKNPALFTCKAFGLLSLYPLFLFVSSFFIGTSIAIYLVYIAFFIFGIAMSAVVISWNISSICFAGDDDVSMYQSVHVTLTGMRGLIMPAFGLLLLKVFGVKTVFAASALFFIVASILSYQLYLKMDKRTFDWKSKINKMQFVFRKVFPF
jgi:MFS family permease